MMAARKRKATTNNGDADANVNVNVYVGATCMCRCISECVYVCVFLPQPRRNILYRRWQRRRRLGAQSGRIRSDGKTRAAALRECECETKEQRQTAMSVEQNAGTQTEQNARRDVSRGRGKSSTGRSHRRS